MVICAGSGVVGIDRSTAAAAVAARHIDDKACAGIVERGNVELLPAGSGRCSSVIHQRCICNLVVPHKVFCRKRGSVSVFEINLGRNVLGSIEVPSNLVYVTSSKPIFGSEEVDVTLVTIVTADRTVCGRGTFTDGICAYGRRCCGCYVVEVGGGAEGFGDGLVGTHIEVIAGLGSQAHEGVVRGIDDGPGSRSLVMRHGGNLPLRFVGKLSYVLLPGGGDGRVGNLRGGDVHNGGHSVVSGEVDALPGRGPFTFAVVLHIEVVVGSGVDVEGHREVGDTAAALGQSVKNVTIGFYVVLGLAEDVVKVVVLFLLGLRPGGHDGGLAGLIDGQIAHRAAGAQGAEGGALPCAVHVVGSTAVRAYIYIVVSIGGEAGEFAGQCCALIDIGASVGIEGGGVKLGIALDDLVAAHIVASGSLPCDGGTILGNVTHLNASHCRAGLIGLAVGGGELRQEVLHSTSASIVCIVGITAGTSNFLAIERDIYIKVFVVGIVESHQQIASRVGERSGEGNGDTLVITVPCDSAVVYFGDDCLIPGRRKICLFSNSQSDNPSTVHPIGSSGIGAVGIVLQGTDGLTLQFSKL